MSAARIAEILTPDAAELADIPDWADVLAYVRETTKDCNAEAQE